MTFAGACGSAGFAPGAAARFDPSAAVTLRLIRIAGFSAGLAYLFHLSRMAGLARGNEELPGTLVAIGILSVLFLVRAAVTESLTEGPATVQKDLLWGLSLGGIITIIVRLAG